MNSLKKMGIITSFKTEMNACDKKNIKGAIEICNMLEKRINNAITQKKNEFDEIVITPEIDPVKLANVVKKAVLKSELTNEEEMI